MADGAGRAWTTTLFSVVVAGVVIGVVEVVLSTSYAVVVFDGALTAHLPRGIGAALFGTTAVLAVVSLTSSLPGAIGGAQDVSAAILGGAAAAVAVQLPAAGETAFATVLVLSGLSSLLVAGWLLVIGTLRLGNVVRFVPYSVIGGFLGGTGALLAEGAIGVLLAAPFSWTRPAALTHATALLRWLPGLAFAALLIIALRRGRSVLVVPIGFLALIAAFFATALATGAGSSALQGGGWLLGPFSEEGLSGTWVGGVASSADWSTIVGQLPAVAILVILSSLGLLLNASGLEVQAGRDLDLNRELRAAGVGNLVGAFGGGLPGYHSVSVSTLASDMGASRRGTGLVAAGICGLALGFGSTAVSLVPRMAVGGLLLFVGLSLLVEWIYDAWFRLAPAEYGVVLLIVLVIAGWGYGPGVITGLVASVLLFLTDYSRIDVVKHALSGASYRANIDRSPAQQALLRDNGDAVHILELQGFLFFGTANALAERIRSRVLADDLPALRFLVLGFGRVTGLDSSAALSFAKVRRFADTKGFRIVMAGLSPAVRRPLARAGLLDGEAVRVLPDLDHAVQWCEEVMLENGDACAALPDAAREGDGVFGFDLAPLRPYLERVPIASGEVLIRQGDTSNDLFFLREGYLTVQLETNHTATRLRSVGPGTIVGELTHYLQTPRTATVVADTACVLYRLSHSALQQLERSDAEIGLALHRSLAQLMAQRIVDNHRTIAALLD